jgi:hypothetical protein
VPEWVGGVPVTENADKTGGQSRPQSIGVHKTVEEATGGWEVTGSGGQAGGDADSANKGTTYHIGDVEGLGQLGDQVTQLLDVAGDAARDTSSFGNVGGGTELAGEAIEKTGGVSTTLWRRR